uniref:Reverse transcriptase zinc-binding domain-containing protein n=1 Tax=Aegilops tauschii subsp. strangulata TaxID=200361 RepID=A0A453RXE5_AEGTS
VLTALPTFAISVLKAPRKFFKEIDKARRKFLWAGDQDIKGEHCKVNWSRVCTPTEQGGLGILKLSKFSTAFHLRWLSSSWE